MRKVLSFVLVLALVLGSFSMAFATPADVAGTGHEEAVNVLMGLGVVDGYEDGSFKPDQAVTRAEMAKLIVVALGLEDYAIGTSSFTDMAGYGWAQGYVAYAASLGVVKGYPDGTFKPGQTVSYDEAAAMIVRALGYTDDSLTGTWPANYVVKAKALGILDGIKSVMGGANRGDIAEMLYNALSLDIGYVNKDGDWTANSDDEDTPDNMLVRLGSEFMEADVITGEEDAAINIRGYVGAYAETYWNDDDEIICVVPQSTFLTGEFTDMDTFEADDVEYTFESGFTYDDGDENSYEFYNGEEGDVLVAEDTTYTLAVDISGKKIKDTYSILEWEASAGFLFDEDYADEIADDQSLAGYDFILDDNDDIDFMEFDWYGAVDLEDIAEDNVVYVYANGDDIRRLEVGKEVVEGEITKINSDQSKITIDGTAYELAGLSEDETAWDELEVEDVVEFYLDYSGDVFSIEIVDAAEGEQYGIILVVQDATTDENPLSGSDAKVKLFLEDGSDEVFDVDDDIDSDLVEDGEWITPAALGCWLVEYGVDEDGVIDYLDLLANNDDYYAETDGEVTSKGYYDGKAIDSDAVIFTFDEEDPTDEDSYGVTTLANIKGDEYDDVDYLVDGKIVAMLISGAGEAEDEVYGVLNDWFQTSASDTGYMATLLVGGEAVDYEVTEALYDDRGDYDFEYLYQLTLNSNDAITALTDQFEVEDVFLDDGTVTDAYSSGILEVGGDEYTIDADAIVYMYDNDDDEFEAVSLSKTNLKVDYWVELYDTDEDLVTDTILVWEAI